MLQNLATHVGLVSMILPSSFYLLDSTPLNGYMMAYLIICVSNFFYIFYLLQAMLQGTFSFELSLHISAFVSSTSYLP